MHPLDAPGTLWVLSRVGKYLVRPQAGETSHEKQIPCGRQETGLPFFSPHRKGFRLCGGDQGAFRSPPGPLRGPSLYAWAKPSTRNRFLAEGKAKAFLAFSRIADRITPKLLSTHSLIRSPSPRATAQSAHIASIASDPKQPLSAATKLDLGVWDAHCDLSSCAQ